MEVLVVKILMVSVFMEGMLETHQCEPLVIVVGVVGVVAGRSPIFMGPLAVGAPVVASSFLNVLQVALYSL